jgi:hypothetical protein
LLVSSKARLDFPHAAGTNCLTMCPGTETSIEDCKRVVRAKLKLPEDTHLHLAHLRPGKVIDLDDGKYLILVYSL